MTPRPLALTVIVSAGTGFALAQPSALTRTLAVAFAAGYLGAHLVAVRGERRRNRSAIRRFGISSASQ